MTAPRDSTVLAVSGTMTRSPRVRRTHPIHLVRGDPSGFTRLSVLRSTWGRLARLACQTARKHRKSSEMDIDRLEIAAATNSNRPQ
ncbi:hypothetical protein N7468_001085 [Penicillium chermesinum]|uniref:Uncharacterized protein n=1 Tax=Penicillium chermesinum TaxID=63820 RepID=A0A9W9PIX9_9EURO|nr:uncharacterized protein N7468_001085 [Penicillium chermesinum]KAJ5246102.1 hypothetical protein N7468_001085 [Penicillium chermesinum]